MRRASISLKLSSWRYYKYWVFWVLVLTQITASLFFTPASECKPRNNACSSRPYVPCAYRFAGLRSHFLLISCLPLVLGRTLIGERIFSISEGFISFPCWFLSLTLLPLLEEILNIDIFLPWNLHYRIHIISSIRE